MSDSLPKMPKEQWNKCHAIIHGASGGAGAAGAIPLPLADTIPITGAQIGMIVSLGKVFDIEVSHSFDTPRVGWRVKP